MKQLLILPLILVGHLASSQNYKIADYDPSANPGQVLKEIKLPTAKTIGNVYLDDTWHTGSFTMKGSSTFDGMLLRYDLQHQNLEIRVENNIRICVLSLLQEFSFVKMSTNQQDNYININTLDNYFVIGHKGVVKVLVDDKAKLFKHYYLETKEADYLPTVDMGSKDNKIIKKSSYYLKSPSSLTKLSTTFKKNKKVFGNNFEKIETFAKRNSLKFKNELHLVAIINYYNTLLSQ